MEVVVAILQPETEPMETKSTKANSMKAKPPAPECRRRSRWRRSRRRRGRQPPSVGDGADGGEVDEGEAASPRVLEAESTKAEPTKAWQPAPKCWRQSRRRQSRRRRSRQPAGHRVPAIPLGRVAVDLAEQACSATPSSWIVAVEPKAARFELLVHSRRWLAGRWLTIAVLRDGVGVRNGERSRYGGVDDDGRQEDLAM